MLDGLLVRQTEVDGLRCCELLGPGDLLRPWDETGTDATFESSAHWRVLQPTRIALLDAGFARRAARWPSLTAELLQRTVARSRSLSVLLALTQARRADVRLRTLFWHLADRWGRVTPNGIVLPLQPHPRPDRAAHGPAPPERVAHARRARTRRRDRAARRARARWILTTPAWVFASVSSAVAAAPRRRVVGAAM